VETFDRYASIYDLVYAEKDTAAEVDFILRQVNNYLTTGSYRILELGAGTGRHARLLIERGHQVIGIESSPEMVRLASRAPGFKPIQGDARNIRLGRTFDVVLALFHVLNYQTSEVDIVDFFRTAHVHLETGALFGFDTWFSPAVHYSKPAERSLFRENNSVSMVRKASPTENLAESKVTIRYDFAVTDKVSGRQESFSEEHVLRHFSVTDIRRYAEQVGFEVLTATEFLTENPPSRETWGVWFILRKA
jgi:SAM-dependent methyltransferase